MLRPTEGNHFKCKCWVEILFTIAMLTSFQQVSKLNKCLYILFISKVISLFHLTLLQLNQRTRGVDLSFTSFNGCSNSFSSLGKVVVTENTRNLTMCVQILATKTKKTHIPRYWQPSIECNALKQSCLSMNMGFYCTELILLKRKGLTSIRKCHGAARNAVEGAAVALNVL